MKINIWVLVGGIILLTMVAILTTRAILKRKESVVVDEVDEVFSRLATGDYSNGYYVGVGKVDHNCSKAFPHMHSDGWCRREAEVIES